MSLRGSLKLVTERGEEREVRCTGDLELVQNTDGGALLQGQLHIYDEEEEDVKAAQEVMERQARGAEGDLAHYSGEIYDVGREGTRVVEGVTLMIQGFDGADNVTVMSTHADT